MSRGTAKVIEFGAAAFAAAALSGAVAADRPLLADELPPALNGVGIVERLDEPVPLDLTFVDETGRVIPLRACFHPDRPVILTLNYYQCPMLCNLTLNGLAAALNGIDWSAGKDFDIVTVSISPEEGPELAAVKKRAYLSQYQRPSAVDGWHFLTGEETHIEALAKAVGFGYRKEKGKSEFAHTASIMFVTPDGRLSRYMNDVAFQAKDVRLALVEASQGSIGSPMEKILLFMCYHYDPEEGGYAVSAMKLMKLGGALTLVTIITGVTMLWRRGALAQQQKDSTGGAEA